MSVSYQFSHEHNLQSIPSYLVGKLAALLWVQGGGETLRIDAQQQAARTWDAIRAGGEVRS
ncbi:MAG: hypothetical protein AB7L09_24775 [Nitrospira sp.]